MLPFFLLLLPYVKLLCVCGLHPLCVVSLFFGGPLLPLFRVTFFFGALVLDTYFLLLAVSFFIQLLFDVAPVQPPSVLQCVVVSLGSACAFSLRTP